MTQGPPQWCFTCFPKSPSLLTFILLNVFREVTAATINMACRFHAIVRRSNTYEHLCYCTLSKGGKRSERKSIALNHFWNTKGILQAWVGNICSTISCRVRICLLASAWLSISHRLSSLRNRENTCMRKREACMSSVTYTAREGFQLLWWVPAYAGTLAAGRMGYKKREFQLEPWETAVAQGTELGKAEGMRGRSVSLVSLQSAVVVSSPIFTSRDLRGVWSSQSSAQTGISGI